MASIQFTYDETCPWCEKRLTDLWDHDWTGTNYIEIECAHCGRPISVLAEVSYVLGKCADSSRIEGKTCKGCSDYELCGDHPFAEGCPRRRPVGGTGMDGEVR